VGVADYFVLDSFRGSADFELVAVAWAVTVSPAVISKATAAMADFGFEVVIAIVAASVVVAEFAAVAVA
jgi:hypothetical protein